MAKKSKKVVGKKHTLSPDTVQAGQGIKVAIGYASFDIHIGATCPTDLPIKESQDIVNEELCSWLEDSGANDFGPRLALVLQRLKSKR